ncbi:hypothetical protein HOG21_01470 [bacterium]|nr:hypothetical protein [bacterium]
MIEEKIDPIEKIKELREKNKYYKTFILANNIKVYFEQKDEKLILLLNKQNI